MRQVMKTAVLVEASNFNIKTVSQPETPDDWLNIRVEACGICGSDLAIYDREPPIPRYWPGHEISGFLEGQPVVVNPLIKCGSCKHCLEGKETICANVKMISHHLPGGFAEYVKAPHSNVFPIKSNIEESTFVEPLASVIHALGVGGDLRGKFVRIVGAGSIGLLLIQLAQMHGADKVEGVGKYHFQNEKMKEFGSVQLGNPADITFVAAGGDGSALQKAVNETAAGGKIVILANVYKSRPLNLKWLIEHELTVVGSQRYIQKDFELAIKLIEDQKIDVRSLITHRFTLDQISLAYDAALNKRDSHAVKVIVLSEGQ